ncbi:class I SAM-dependent methyltransferase [Halovivax sp.]|uniref:class I SAM-dependent methyltransferase n=1 Tax=Halovivax sp. TaxID=1935978 RepID=UPI0025C30A2D|nr:class I SAM-dependent methyltransferase [Halovivax sp.]
MSVASDLTYACRRCGSELQRRDDALRCRDCGEAVPVVDGDLPRFPVPEDASSGEELFDRLAAIYETPAWFSPLYRLVGGPFAPRDDRTRVVRMLAVGRVADREGGRATVLDVACGTGRFTRAVAPSVDRAVGIDVSEGMLERARRYADRAGIENATFARMSADELWFADGTFDGAACCWALHLLPDPDAALDEVRRVLRDGGWFAGATLVDRYVMAAPTVRAAARATIGADPFAPADLRARLREAGFEEVEFDRRGAALFFGARAA